MLISFNSFVTVLWELYVRSLPLYLDVHECLSSGLGWCPHTLFGVYYTQDKKKKEMHWWSHCVLWSQHVWNRWIPNQKFCYFGSFCCPTFIFHFEQFQYFVSERRKDIWSLVLIAWESQIARYDNNVRTIHIHVLYIYIYIYERVKCTRGPLTYEEVSVRSINFESDFLGP